MGYSDATCGGCRHWHKLPAENPEDVTAVGLCRERLHCGLAPVQTREGPSLKAVPYFPPLPHHHPACSHHEPAPAAQGGDTDAAP